MKASAELAAPLAAWFGNSQIRAEDGSPRVVYRGESSGENFNIFDRGQTHEDAFFFTFEREVAQDYASGRPPRAFYLHAERILDLTTENPEARAFVREWATLFDDWTDRKTGEPVDPFDAVLSGELFEYEESMSMPRWRSLQRHIAYAGYDGALLADMHGRRPMTAVIVFRPEQIKSADHNNGDYSRDSPDIFLRQTGSGDEKPSGPAPLEAWFGRSKVAHANGAPRAVFHGSRAPWIVEFDPAKIGTGIVNGLGGSRLRGYWFGSTRGVAEFFADRRPRRSVAEVVEYGEASEQYAAAVDSAGEVLFSVGPRESEKAARDELQQQIDRYSKASTRDHYVISAYLAISNPLELDGTLPRGAHFEQALAEGRDGIIARNVLDGSDHGDVYVAFRPEQIKSARFNIGTFRQDTRNIYLRESDAAAPPQDRPTVFHGTGAKFEAFDPDYAQVGIFGKGFYFTDRRDMAAQYAEGEGARVLSARLAISNPAPVARLYALLDQAEEAGSDPDGVQQTLRKEGYDGLIVPMLDGQETLYVAFDPQQIELQPDPTLTAPGEAKLRQTGSATKPGSLSWRQLRQRLAGRTLDGLSIERREASRIAARSAHWRLSWIDPATGRPVDVAGREPPAEIQAVVTAAGAYLVGRDAAQSAIARGDWLAAAVALDASEAKPARREAPAAAAPRPLGLDAWFAGSRITDPAGQPLRVYHGGRRFDQFALDPAAKAHYASEDLYTAYTYASQYNELEAEIKPLYLRVLRPLDLRDPQAFARWTGIEDAATAVQMAARSGPLRSGGHLLDRIRDAGHDGVIFYDTNVYNRGVATAYAFFDPSQSKAADPDLLDGLSYHGYPIRQDRNSGDFDSAKLGLYERAAPDEPEIGYHGTQSGRALKASTATPLWFSETPELAVEYAQQHEAAGEVVRARISPRSTFAADHLPPTCTIEAFFDAIAIQGGVERHELKDLETIVAASSRMEESGPYFSRHDFWYELPTHFGAAGAEAIREAYVRAGFDAIVYTELGARTIGALTDSAVELLDRAPVSSLASQGLLLRQTGDEPVAGRARRGGPAASATGPAEFARWFGLSPTVDKNGNALVFYHGTKGAFAAFDLDRCGESAPGPVGDAVYCTQDPREASRYAEDPDYGAGESPNVIPLVVALQHPAWIVDGRLPNGKTLEEYHAGGISLLSAKRLNTKLKEDGYDGALFLRGNRIVEVAAFEPDQVRTAFPYLARQAALHLKKVEATRTASGAPRGYTKKEKPAVEALAPTDQPAAASPPVEARLVAQPATASEVTSVAAGISANPAPAVSEGAALDGGDIAAASSEEEIHDELSLTSPEFRAWYAKSVIRAPLAAPSPRYIPTSIAMADDQGELFRRLEVRATSLGNAGVRVKKLKQAYLAIRSPLYLPPVDAWDYPSVINAIVNTYPSLISPEEYEYCWNAAVPMTELRATLADAGYDGIISGAGQHAVFVPFRAEQVRYQAKHAIVPRLMPEVRADIYLRQDDEAPEQPHPISLKNPIVDDATAAFVDFSTIGEALGRERAREIAIDLDGYIRGLALWHERAQRFGAEAGKANSVADLLAANPKLLDNLYVDASAVLGEPRYMRWFAQAGYDGAVYAESGGRRQRACMQVFSVDGVDRAQKSVMRAAMDALADQPWAESTAGDDLSLAGGWTVRIRDANSTHAGVSDTVDDRGATLTVVDPAGRQVGQDLWYRSRAAARADAHAVVPRRMAAAGAEMGDLFGGLVDASAQVRLPRPSGSGQVGDFETYGNQDNRQRQISPTAQGLERFWSWYRESKLLEGDGRPVLLFHGAAGDATRESHRAGILLSPSPERAAAFAAQGMGARLIPAYARMTQIADLDEPSEELESELEDVGFETRHLWTTDLSRSELLDEENGGFKLVAALRRAGYDGATFTEDDGSRAFVALGAHQIKSPFNRGSFNQEEADILLRASSANRLRGEHGAATPSSGLQEVARRLRARGTPARLVPYAGSFPALEAVAARFGMRLKPFVQIDSQRTTEGAVMPDDPRHIYLNVFAKHPLMAILGHELTHQLRLQDQDAYDSLYRVAARHYTGHGQLDEESLCDYVGSHMVNPTFLRAVDQERPGLAGRLLVMLERLCARAMDAIEEWLPLDLTTPKPAPALDGAELLNDTRQLRQAAIEALRHFRDQQSARHPSVRAPSSGSTREPEPTLET